MKKIVFCGGGTAGHVMPNIALIENLQSNKKIEIHYIGGAGIEKKILEKYKNITYHEINPPKLIRSFTLKNLTLPFSLIKSIINCKKLLKEISPNVIFSKGGFISVPVVLASKKIPVIGHESDYTMGLANKIIYKFADKMFFSFSDTALQYPKKGEYSGTPIRKKIYKGKNLKCKLNINNNLNTILIVGGSSGASYINEFIYKNIDELCRGYNIIHITGKQKQQAVVKLHTPPNYYKIEYAENIEDYITTADFIISRAGSNSIFEFLELRKPMILIPLPKDQSRGDQILNANYFSRNNLAITIQQEELTLDNLKVKLKELKTNKESYIKNMKNFNQQNGTTTIFREIKKYL